MFERHLTKNLKEGEEVLQYVRRYGWSLLLPGLIAGIVFFSPFFFLFPLLRLGLPGVLGLLIVFLAGILLLIRLVVLYSLNVLLITNYRLIDVDQRGLFHREVSECTYDRIADVSFSMRGIPQTLLHYGNVQIQTAGSQANLEVRNVRGPDRVQELIMKLQSEVAKRADDEAQLSADELLQLVNRLKRGLGDDKFREILRK
ncbi:MAG: PH domain-containing protein [Candidatus Kerfeldbacteria bacterium]|nr:PH domain-containing protein [Candidatus Kerfeldbacteria bacterium]